MKAIEKIKNELEKGKSKLSQKGKAVAGSVVEALNSFIEQNSEFAQAVEQSDKPVTDCIEQTVKGVGSSVSDLEVYNRAVNFYFPGAKVHFEMHIDLGDGGFSNAPKSAPTTQDKPTGLKISLDDLLG